MDLAKWDWTKTLLIPMPFVCLAAYLADAPLPLPSRLLPERRYLAMTREVDAGAFQEARGRGESLAVLAGGLSPLPPGGPALEKARAALPDEPVLGPVVDDLAAGLGPFRTGRVVLSQVPLAGELAALQEAAARSETPLAVELRAAEPTLPLQALSLRYSPTDRQVAFDLLLAPEARGQALVEVAAGPAGGGGSSTARPAPLCPPTWCCAYRPTAPRPARSRWPSPTPPGGGSAAVFLWELICRNGPGCW